MLADENDSVTDTYDYDAFGNLTNSTGSTANNYRYCGEQYDGTTGLYYLRARYMNPNTGTFISMDSYAGSIFEPVSLHKYLYANANPVMYEDPSGYMASLGEVVVTVGALIQLNAQTICAQAFIGALIGGMTNTTLNWLKGGSTPPAEAFIQGMIVGGIGGAAFGVLGVIAQAYWEVAIISAAIKIYIGGYSLYQGYQDAAEGYYAAAILENGLGYMAIFSGINDIIPANAGEISNARATADSTTNTEDPQTATNQNAGEYLSNKAPYQVTPGTRQLNGQYVNGMGRVEPWTAYYDEYGRLIARTDYNAGNKSAGIPNIHYHTYEWSNPGTAGHESGSHIEGEYYP